MKTIIKQYGNSNVITLDREYMNIYDFKVGDVVEVRINHIAKHGK